MMDPKDFDICMNYAKMLSQRFEGKAQAISTNVGEGVGSASEVRLKRHASTVVLRIVNRDTAQMMPSVLQGSVTAYVEQLDPIKNLPQSFMREALADEGGVRDWVERAYEKIMTPSGFSPEKEELRAKAIQAQALDYLEMDNEKPLTEIPVLEEELLGEGASGVAVDPDLVNDMTDKEAAKLALDLSLEEAASESGDCLEVSVEDHGAKTRYLDGRTLKEVSIVQGDITKSFEGEDLEGHTAVVNAANVTLLGGGGVDGAIHKAAGPELKAACEALPIQARTKEVRCHTGDAVATDGFHLAADFVIHTVGPIFEGTIARNCRYETEKPLETEEGRDKLNQALVNCLIQAEVSKIRHIAFPAISCGVFGCPIWLFAEELMKTINAADWDVDSIRVVMFQDQEFNEMKRCWKNLHAGVPQC